MTYKYLFIIVLFLGFISCTKDADRLLAQNNKYSSILEEIVIYIDNSIELNSSTIDENNIEEIKSFINQSLIDDYFTNISVIDLDGNTIIHTSEESVNLLDVQDSRGTFVTRDMIEQKKGSFVYYWKNKNDKKETKKFLIFDNVDNYIIYIGGYLLND